TSYHRGASRRHFSPWLTGGAMRTMKGQRFEATHDNPTPRSRRGTAFMLTTLALLGTLALAPAQGELKFEKTRFLYGPLGQTRANEKFLPGDVVHLASVVKGLKIKDGNINYSMAFEILKKGQKSPVQKRDAIEYKQMNALGGNDLPILSFYEIP